MAGQSQSTQFGQAIALFDAANGEDPTRIDGVAAELIYSRRMREWLERLYPEASEALRLAAASQHIRRWMIPRSSYPMTRAGYHQWRKRLYDFHADTAGGILESIDYEPAIVARVRQLLRKENLKTDPEMQALEDVICLVFLENYFADFLPRYDEEKVVGILRRTWGKMTAKGHAAAMELKLSEVARGLVEKAVGGG